MLTAATFRAPARATPAQAPDDVGRKRRGAGQGSGAQSTARSSTGDTCTAYEVGRGNAVRAAGPLAPATMPATRVPCSHSAAAVHVRRRPVRGIHAPGHTDDPTGRQAEGTRVARLASDPPAKERMRLWTPESSTATCARRRCAGRPRRRRVIGARLTSSDVRVPQILADGVTPAVVASASSWRGSPGQ